MGTVTAFERPMQRGFQVSASGVTAKGVDSTVTNGCIFLTLPDETCLMAFTSGLDAKGVLYNVTDLTVRFFLRNNH